MKKILCAGVLAVLITTVTWAVQEEGKVENFQKDWKAVPNSVYWKAVSTTEVHFAYPPTSGKTKKTESIFTRAMEQSGAMQYEWSLKWPDLSHSSVFYFFSKDQANRNSYAIWLWQKTDKDTGKKENILNVDKITAGKLVPVHYLPIELTVDLWIKMRVKFDPNTGNFTVWRNEEEVVKCTDSKPFKNGSFIGLGTDASPSAYKDMIIRKLP